MSLHIYFSLPSMSCIGCSAVLCSLLDYNFLLPWLNFQTISCIVNDLEHLWTLQHVVQLFLLCKVKLQMHSNFLLILILSKQNVLVSKVSFVVKVWYILHYNKKALSILTNIIATKVKLIPIVFFTRKQVWSGKMKFVRLEILHLTFQHWHVKMKMNSF